jgi:anti-sigma regulatory factor (Ser/Thr protein kinase)
MAGRGEAEKQRYLASGAVAGGVCPPDAGRDRRSDRRGAPRIAKEAMESGVEGAVAITWRTEPPAVFTGDGPCVGEVHLAARPESSATARGLTADVLRSWGLFTSHGEVAEQLVGELVANAVRHTGGRYLALCLGRRLGWLRIEVRDPSRALPCLIKPEPVDEAGRGLFLVDQLSDRWGADLLQRGKGVWFELRVREPRPGRRGVRC